MKLADKIRRLKDPGAYPRPTHSVTIVDTHMSVVFLTDDRAYKLKKPVHFPFLDYRTLAARRHFCAQEIEINQALAKGIYPRTVPLVRQASGTIVVGGDGEVIDWMVEMVRLPGEQMLDYRLANTSVSKAEMRDFGEKMVAFYREQATKSCNAACYLDYLFRETEISGTHLSEARPLLGSADAQQLRETIIRHLKDSRREIEQRITDGRIVDGHGDLRPEHVCLISPPVVIDRLDFDPTMRILDPYDEIGYLGMECTLLGAPWIKKALIDILKSGIGHPPSSALLATYTMFRAFLRARIAIDHLRDEDPKTPEQWPLRARAYLEIVEDVAGRTPA